MLVCNFCKKIPKDPVELLCCNLLACLTCAAPGFYGGAKICPGCSKNISEDDFARQPEMYIKIERLRGEFRKRKEKILSTKERKRLKQMLSCTSCSDLCAKAVSMDCCYPSATCRKCALRSLREDNTRCWGCGKVSENVFTPSHVFNNDLVRIGVAFLKEHQGEERITVTFEIFALLHKDLSKIVKRKSETLDLVENPSHNTTEKRELEHSEEMKLHELLVKDQMNLFRNGEPQYEREFGQLEVRNTFTGTGNTKFNKELSKGRRRFDGSTIQEYRERRVKAKGCKIPPPRNYHARPYVPEFWET